MGFTLCEDRVGERLDVTQGALRERKHIPEKRGLKRTKSQRMQEGFKSTDGGGVSPVGEKK